MDLQLSGKTALVTGGSEGIGKGIAIALAKEGVDVAICARRKDVLEATAAEIGRATNRKIIAIPADLRKDADARSFIERATRSSAASTSWSTTPAPRRRRHRDADRGRLGERPAAQVHGLRAVPALRAAVMVKQGGGRVVNLIGNDGVKPSYWEMCRARNAAGQDLTKALAGQYGKRASAFAR